MATMEFKGSTIELDDDNCLVNRSDWSKDLANAIAVEEGIETLTERHWVVINFLQKTWDDSGQPATIRAIKNDAGVGTKELYQLFPKGPVKKAARIAGLPKPKSCI